MKRRVCAILLAASLAVCGLTGCGNGSQSSAGKSKTDGLVSVRGPVKRKRRMAADDV